MNEEQVFTLSMSEAMDILAKAVAKERLPYGEYTYCVSHLISTTVENGIVTKATCYEVRIGYAPKKAAG